MLRKKPEPIETYPAEVDHIIENIQTLYAEPIYSLEREAEKEKKIADLFARKRQIESWQNVENDEKKQ